MPAEIPLFPLRTVLFPGGPQPLRVFEPRYLDMLSRCMKSDSGFGLILIREGQETGPADLCEVGTEARIVDWYMGSDGVLGITTLGTRRFSLLRRTVQPDGLNTGEVRMWEDEPLVPLPEEYQDMAQILRAVWNQLGQHYAVLEQHHEDAGWVGMRLAEVLPIPLEQKQQCLELTDPLERLALLSPLLGKLRRRE